MTTTSEKAGAALSVLLNIFGLGVGEVAAATGARIPEIRKARTAHSSGAPVDLAPEAAAAMVRLVDVLWAAVVECDAAGTPVEETVVSGRLLCRVDPALAVTVLDVFASGQFDDLVRQALTQTLTGADLLDAWRPDWRTELAVTEFGVVVAADGVLSLVHRPFADIAADRERLQIPA